MMKTVIMCAVLLATMVQTEPSELDVLEQKYEDAQFAIDLNFAKARDDALVAYGKSLDAYMAHFKKSGKLNAYLELEAEKVRFIAEETVLPFEVQKNPYIQKAAKEYERVAAEAMVTTEKKTTHLVRQYVIRLESLIKELMQEDRIEEAKLVNDELALCKRLLKAIESDSKMAQPVKKTAEPDSKVEPVKKTAEPVKVVLLRKSVPADAREYGGHHYKMFHSSRISWSNAKMKCEEMGGHLATPDSAEEIAFFKQYKGQKKIIVVWLGGHLGQYVNIIGKIKVRIDSGFLANVPSTYISYYICEWDY